MEKLSAKAKARGCFKTTMSAPPTWGHWHEDLRHDSHATTYPGGARWWSIRACSRWPVVNFRGPSGLERRPWRAPYAGRLRNILALHALANRYVPFAAGRSTGAVRAWSHPLVDPVSVRR